MKSLVRLCKARFHHLAHLVLACCLASGVAPAVRAATLQDFARGAEGAFSTCAAQPSGDQLCDDFRVQFFPEGVNSGVGTAVFLHFRAVIHPDGSADESIPEGGFAEGIAGFHDGSRLAFAHMDPVRLDLSDIDPATGATSPNGRSVLLGPFDWSAASAIHVYGNDGPFGFFGLPHLVVGRCVTQVYNAHERFTAAIVTGTINGVSVTEIGPSFLPWPGTGPANALGAIFDLRLNLVDVDHSRPCSSGRLPR